MKTILATASFVAALGTMAVTASAAAFDFDGMQVVSKLAYTDFTVAQPAHVEHFTGFKTWQSGDDARVKIYVNHDGMAMEFNYLCHVHETGPECHRQ